MLPLPFPGDPGDIIRKGKIMAPCFSELYQCKAIRKKVESEPVSIPPGSPETRPLKSGAKRVQIKKQGGHREEDKEIQQPQNIKHRNVA